MYGKVVINNTPSNPKRYIVATFCDGELWYWGSWDDKDKAENAANASKSRLVLERID